VWAHHGEVLDASHWEPRDVIGLVLLLAAVAATIWWLRRK
jgi:hypothetical protein